MTGLSGSLAVRQPDLKAEDQARRRRTLRKRVLRV
jgi:hypothetical protein